MVFSSSLFLFLFLPIFFCTYFLVGRKQKNAIIIIGSIFFYGWGANWFLLIVLVTMILDYRLGFIIADCNGKRDKALLRRICIGIDVVVNIGILIYFKYTNFLLANINVIFTKLGFNPVVFTEIVLPIGISFVIFQKVTYCLDIARGKAKPADNYFYYLEYLLVFPQIIAGPIVRYSDIADQIKNRENNYENFMSGFIRFSQGLFKKVWIADILAKYADIVFAMPSESVPIHYAWFGIMCYTFQIYFDFSAYSDMAIGLLRAMGFRIPENFNAPYISKSITEFWKRWHISLTSWMREYLYIPLGGNRKGKFRTYLNQWIVFIVSGFWHGASWNFIFWGFYHGTLICAEKIYLLKKTEKVPAFIKQLFTFVLISCGWVFFRSETMRYAFSYIGTMFNPLSYSVLPATILYVDHLGIVTFLLAAIISVLPAIPAYRNLAELAKIKKRGGTFIAVVSLCLFAVSALKVSTASVSPFIYFRF
jgi:alginate O-acetyltransferase complex protein AlgI